MSQLHENEVRQPTPAGPGQVLAGKYRICRLVGRGGMASVFEARHVDIGRRVAIKMLQPRFVHNDSFLTRFEREARLSGSLEHENLVAVLDVGRGEAAQPFIVMEYVEGRTLRSLLEAEGAQSIERAVDLVRQACLGLSAAHGQGVLHRDIKPENLVVGQSADGSDWLKVVDFGVACRIHASDVALTSAEAQVGTPHYMAPETAEPGTELDVRADVYALGVVLFELLTGKKPYSGRSYHAVMYNIANSKAPSIRRFRPRVPKRLCRIVARALSPNRQQRIANCWDLYLALEPFASTLPALSCEQTATTIADLSPPLAASRSNPWRMLALALLVVIGFLLAVTASQLPLE